MNSHLTAIARSTLPLPTRWMAQNGLIKGHVLDFGCGKCKPLNDRVLTQIPGVRSVDSYDPHFEPNGIKEGQQRGEGWYNTILCTYVLCTLPEREERPILKRIQKLLRKTGVAYVTVRADEPKNGYGISSKKTFQRDVQISYLPLFRDTAQYRIYLLTPTADIPTRFTSRRELVRVESELGSDEWPEDFDQLGV